MSKEYDETKVKPAPSISQEPEKISGSKVQNVLSKREFKINFDDAKYAVKTVKTQFAQTEQQPSKLRDFLKSIPIIGRFLVRVFIPEKEAHKKSQAVCSSKTRHETSVDDEYTQKVGSRLEKSNVEQVDDKKGHSL
ncbi:hypothetical protein HET73_02750 [Wolbachia endosymbiont of Atemnus politus]|uniref:hypothetical protein n=1 Tax=Wolbachia endosymbiont of Atemnus politus TaxID=2682840 RepID=UPI001572F0C6|nr:hypothetical protein [Wolbachia endosymbiont of Atemnus politus]NSM56482.1 hypothetical protein [Wolbachia endosymbiont of Atemnus politus]NSX83323.1 hypothetical protein [Wolbachia endosymbiont of Atemnus politus]